MIMFPQPTVGLVRKKAISTGSREALPGLEPGLWEIALNDQNPM